MPIRKKGKVLSSVKTAAINKTGGKGLSSIKSGAINFQAGVKKGFSSMSPGVKKALGIASWFAPIPGMRAFKAYRAGKRVEKFIKSGQHSAKNLMQKRKNLKDTAPATQLDYHWSFGGAREKQYLRKSMDRVSKKWGKVDPSYPVGHPDAKNIYRSYNNTPRKGPSIMGKHWRNPNDPKVQEWDKLDMSQRISRIADKSRIWEKGEKLKRQVDRAKKGKGKFPKGGKG